MDGLDSRVILPFCFLLEDRKEREGREKKKKKKILALSGTFQPMSSYESSYYEVKREEKLLSELS